MADKTPVNTDDFDKLNKTFQSIQRRRSQEVSVVQADFNAALTSAKTPYVFAPNCRGGSFHYQQRSLKNRFGLYDWKQYCDKSDEGYGESPKKGITSLKRPKNETSTRIFKLQLKNIT
ncbi:hypothetical protein P5673_026140, partial [Acropora cervicornis]